MRSFQTLGPSYLPRLWDVIKVSRRGRGEPIYGRVVHVWGGNKQGKINVLCKSGPKAMALHLIWRDSTGWNCWIENARYDDLRVEKYTEKLPQDVESYLGRK